jgi:predicted enzyme related to lactoylglutathione lyase
MKRVTGLGGILFKCKDPNHMRAWYETHLGFQTDQYGTTFEWRKASTPSEKGYTAWSPMKDTTTYFAPSEQEFMVNYRVADLEALVIALKEEGVTIVDEIETYEYGKFVHILDPEGNKIELWEPVDEVYHKMLGVTMGE